MRALTVVEIRRPWHWGVAILSDPGWDGELPALDVGGRAEANDHGVVLSVRHAQDVDTQDDESAAWAEASVTIRVWPGPPVIDEDRTVVLEGTVATPTRQLSVGDADGATTVAGLAGSTAIRVLLSPDDLDSPDHVLVDLWPA